MLRHVVGYIENFEEEQFCDPCTVWSGQVTESVWSSSIVSENTACRNIGGSCVSPYHYFNILDFRDKQR